MGTRQHPGGSRPSAACPCPTGGANRLQKRRLRSAACSSLHLGPLEVLLGVQEDGGMSGLIGTGGVGGETPPLPWTAPAQRYFSPSCILGTADRRCPAEV